MEPRYVLYRGQRMTADWPAKIRAAQRRPTVTRDGVTYARIPYGQEAFWPEIGMEPHPTCGDCGVIPGEYHVECCDTEACPICLSGQWLCCQDGPCPTDFTDDLDAIEQLPETTTDVYEPRIVIPDNQLPLFGKD